jgi:hypothetical protein
VATVRAFRVPGLKIWFWSQDHEPPHFHAKREGEWEMKVHFLRVPGEMLELVWADRRPPRRILQQLACLAEEHRLALLEQWETILRK